MAYRAYNKNLIKSFLYGGVTSFKKLWYHEQYNKP